MTELVCMRCGAGLEASELADGLRCPACATVHAFEPAPELGQAPLIGLTMGEPVLAEWGGRWWRAELVERITAEPERWRVRFLGWSDAWVQELDRGRIHEFGSGAPVRRWKLVLALVGVGILLGTGVLLANKGKLVSTTGTMVEPDTALVVGQPIEIERDGSWVAGEVIGLLPDGRVRVRVLDRGPTSDESLERAKLRLP